MGLRRQGRRSRSIGYAVLAIFVIAIVGNAPGSADRQRLKFEFTSERPGAATGVKSDVRFSSEGPETGVETILTRLERGAEVDTSVPKRCAASDEELAAQGAAACPPASHVGGGLVEVAELGIGELTLFNADGETIFLSEFGEPPIRAVSRESVARPTHRIDIAEGVTIRRTKFEIDRIRKDGEGYIETPENCPPKEKWVNQATFVYRDGVEQREKKPAPCERT